MYRFNQNMVCGLVFGVLFLCFISGSSGLNNPKSTVSSPKPSPIFWDRLLISDIFGNDPLLTGLEVEYPITWVITADTVTGKVIFSDQSNPPISLTFIPAQKGKWMSAVELAGAVITLLQQTVPDLSFLNRKETTGHEIILFHTSETATECVGTSQGILTHYSILTTLYRSESNRMSVGRIIICQAPVKTYSVIFQRYFDRMIQSSVGKRTE
ncbi:MAG: hypothetical protein NTX88_07540 [Candidatus Atribacteria bacterium]|nr:hypothetical protein [Candidatus Atribacteria bacterium]